MQVLVKVVIYIVLLYAIVLLVTYIFQRKLIYVPERVDTITPAEWGVAEMQVVMLHTSDNINIAVWYRKADPHKPTVVFMHGNAGHIGHRILNIKPFLQHGYGVLLIDYRGYSTNSGKPSEQGLYRDARAAMQFLQQQSVACQDIILHGESLGSAVAVQMATEFPVSLLVLQAPFNRLSDVGKAHYPFLPVHILLKDEFDSESKIADIKMPLLILHGDSDSIVPMQLSKKLFAIAHQPKRYIEYPGLHHNDIDPNKIAEEVILYYQQNKESTYR